MANDPIREWLESLPDDMVDDFMYESRTPPPSPQSPGMTGFTPPDATFTPFGKPKERVQGGGGGGGRPPFGGPLQPMSFAERQESQYRQGAPGVSPNALPPVPPDALQPAEESSEFRPPSIFDPGMPMRDYADFLAKGYTRDANRIWGAVPTALRTAVPGHDTPDASQAVREWWEGAGQATYSQWLREHGVNEPMSMFMGTLLEFAEPGVGPNQAVALSKLGESIWGVIPFGRLAARTGKPAREELNRVMHLRETHGVNPAEGVGGMGNFKQSMRNMKTEFDAQNAANPMSGPTIEIYEPVNKLTGNTEYRFLSPTGDAQLVMKPKRNPDTGAEELWVVALERRGGVEGSGMHPSVLSFMEFADAHDITVRTHPSAFVPLVPGGAEYRRPTTQLREMYAKAGFVDDPTGTAFGTADYRMVREPLPTDKAARKEVADARERSIINPETGTTLQQQARTNRRLLREHDVDVESITHYRDTLLNEYNHYTGRDPTQIQHMVNDNYSTLFNEQTPLAQLLPDEMRVVRSKYDDMMRQINSGDLDTFQVRSDLIELAELLEDEILYVIDALEAPRELESALHMHRDLILDVFDRATRMRVPTP